ncbi:MAG TPA: ABC transporter permease [Marmoricola sp.]|nr:ABC transporter permease [Marmoricola sp.]
MSAVLAPVRTRQVGLGQLVRLAVRRDRVMVPAWFAALLLVCFASASATATLYTTEADRVKAAEAINSSPGIVALYGPIVDVHSEGELAMTKMTVLYAVFVALMFLFVVRRHTRLEEEGGQSELLGGTAITRQAPLTAAIGFGFALALVLGVLTAAANVAGGLPVAGSLAFGASWAGIGLVSTTLTAAACQVSSSARTCAGIAAVGLGVLYLLRAVGDTSDASWLSWLTPFGWNTQLRAYSDPRWWILALYVGTALALAGLAFWLSHRRDLGSGLVAARPGPATGSPRLADAVALAIRVHTPMVVGWTVAVGVVGLVFGAISPSFDKLDSQSLEDMMRRIGGSGAFREALLGAVVSVLGLIVTCFAVAVVGHGGSDEQDGRTEQVLATATSRARAFLATLVVGILGATWLLLVAGVALAVGVGNDAGLSFGRLVGSALAQAPAMWLVVALSVLVFAWRSDRAVLGWGLVVVFTTLGLVGELLDLPQWVLDLSPYTHTPHMPLEDFRLGPAALLSLLAAVLLAVSWWRYRSRDIG